MVIALLVPHITYGDVLFSPGLDAFSRNTISKAFKACVRYVFGLKKRESVDGFRMRILGCVIFDYFRYRSDVFLHNLVLTRNPSYLYEKISLERSVRSRNLVVPFSTLVRFHASLFVSRVINYSPHI